MSDRDFDNQLEVNDFCTIFAAYKTDSVVKQLLKKRDPKQDHNSEISTSGKPTETTNNPKRLGMKILSATAGDRSAVILPALEQGSTRTQSESSAKLSITTYPAIKILASDALKFAQNQQLISENEDIAAYARDASALCEGGNENFPQGDSGEGDAKCTIALLVSLGTFLEKHRRPRRYKIRVDISFLYPMLVTEAYLSNISSLVDKCLSGHEYAQILGITVTSAVLMAVFIAYEAYNIYKYARPVSEEPGLLRPKQA